MKPAPQIRPPEPVATVPRFTFTPVQPPEARVEPPAGEPAQTQTAEATKQPGPAEAPATQKETAEASAKPVPVTGAPESEAPYIGINDLTEGDIKELNDNSFKNISYIGFDDFKGNGAKGATATGAGAGSGADADAEDIFKDIPYPGTENTLDDSTGPDVDDIFKDIPYYDLENDPGNSPEDADEAAKDAADADKNGLAGERREKRERAAGKMNANSKKKKKNSKKRKRKESIPAKIVKWAVSVIVVMIIAVVVMGGVYVYQIIKDIPRYSSDDIEASLNVMSTMYDDQGHPMKNIYLSDGQRTLVTYQQLPKNLVNALIAIEDKTFWKHKGFNIIRMAGAIIESYRRGTGVSGASGTSTLTQQLARNIWLIEEKTERSIDRKIKEAFYARELEKNLTKEEILTIYLNTIALGNHSYGIEAASEGYFGKKVEDLDLLESAALAALPKAPSEFAMITTVMPGDVDPDDPRILLTGSQYVYLYNNAIEPRLKLVLSEMYAQEYITKDEYDKAMKGNIRSHLHPREIEASSNADFFVAYAIENIANDLLKTDPSITSRDEAIQRIYSRGYDIYTTFNQRAQDIATEEYSNPDNFPTAQLTYTDKNGSLLNHDDDSIVLFSYDYMFEQRDDGPWFHLIYDESEDPEVSD